MALDIANDPEKQADSNAAAADSDSEPGPAIADKALEKRLVRKIDFILMPGLGESPKFITANNVSSKDTDQ